MMVLHIDAYQAGSVKGFEGSEVYLIAVTMNQQAVLDDDQAVLGLFDKYCEL